MINMQDFLNNFGTAAGVAVFLSLLITQFFMIRKANEKTLLAKKELHKAEKQSKAISEEKKELQRKMLELVQSNFDMQERNKQEMQKKQNELNDLLAQIEKSKNRELFLKKQKDDKKPWIS